MFYLIRCFEKKVVFFRDDLVEKVGFEYNYEETFDKVRLRDILGNNWFVFLKNVDVMKDRESLRNFFRLKEVMEIDNWMSRVI